MKKKIYYPNLKQIDQKGTVSREEYGEQLFELYTSRAAQVIDKDLLQDIIFFVQHTIENTVGRVVGCYFDAAQAISVTKSLSHLPIEEIKQQYKKDGQIGFIYPLAVIYKGESESAKFILEERCGIRPCDNKTVILAQEITAKVMEDIERATREQMTFAQRFSPRRSDENKVEWANRVSATSHPSAAQQSSAHKKVIFSPDL
jgi:hypothetical protein